VCLFNIRLFNDVVSTVIVIQHRDVRIFMNS
jgi:hypothetical protein